MKTPTVFVLLSNSFHTVNGSAVGMRQNVPTHSAKIFIMDKFHVFGQMSMYSLVFFMHFLGIYSYFHELLPHFGGGKEISVHTFLSMCV